MGDSLNKVRFEKDTEIRRTKSSGDLSKKPLIEDGVPFENKDTGSVKKKNKTAGKKASKMTELKDYAKGMPVHKPEKKAQPKKGAKPLTKKEQERLRIENERKLTAGELEKLHKTLDEEELKAFGKKGAADIRRTRYSAMDAGDKEKRVKSAMSRKNNAEKIREAEALLGDMSWEHSVLDREEFLEKLRTFMNLSGEPYSMSKDADFANNLEKNYRLCEMAWKMRKWVEDAVELGYFPEKTSLEDVEARINRFLDLKEYLDTQRHLMKNPYYQYMQKADISYTGDQIENLRNRTKNTTLQDYLSTVQKLRGLAYVRKKGMSSVKERSIAKGKRQAEILKNRGVKRQIEKIFSDEAMVIRGNHRFRDKNYDKKYTPAVFQDALRGFNMIRVKDLHFKNIKDIAENFRENTRIFDETREFEHLLFVAVQRGDAPADEDMIMLRSKIKAIKSAEYMVTLIQNRIITDPAGFRDRTYEEFLTECREEIKSSVSPDETIEVPMPGMNMESFYSGILKTLKRAHSDRGEEIRRSYRLTHPNSEIVGEAENAATVWHTSEITNEELRRRKADYQKNVFINDYIAELKAYSEDVYGKRVSSFAAVYGKRKNRKDLSSVFNRVINQYVLGMSSDELKKVVDTLAFENDDKKQELRDQILKEARSANLTKIGTNDKNVFMNNLAWSNRMANILMDIDILKAGKKEDPEIDTLYHAGCSHTLIYQIFADALRSKFCRSIPLADWFTMDTDKQSRFNAAVTSEEAYVRDGKVTVDGRTLMKNEDEIAAYSKALLSLSNYGPSQVSEFNKDRRDEGCKNTPYITMYEARKHFGLINDTSAEDIVRLRKFYNANAGAVRSELSDPSIHIGQDVETCEKYFKRIMSFDLSLFNYSSYIDIMESAGKDLKRYSDCAAAALDNNIIINMNLIGTYRDALNNEDLKGSCSLNEEQLKEVEARCDVINSASVFFDGTFSRILKSNVLSKLIKPELSLEDILHLSQAEIEECKNDAGSAERRDFWGEVSTFTTRLKGFDMGMDIRGFVQARRFDRGLFGESKEQEIVDILNKKTSILKDCVRPDLLYTCESEEQFLGHFAPAFSERKLTVTEREDKMNNTASRLYAKRISSERLKAARDEAINNRIAARRAIPLEYRRLVGEESLIHLSGFLSTTDRRENKKLVEEYADKDKRTAFLDRLTQQIFDARFNHTITTDSEFINCVSEFEKISSMIMGYKALLKDNPDYMKELRNRTLVDYDEFISKLDTLTAVSDYYRARTLLISDPYYISHYNEELSANHDDRSTEDQRYVADLIRLVAECSRRLGRESLTSRSASGMDDLLDTMEMKSRRRGYLFGQADLKKADISHAKKADRQIKQFFDKVLEDLNRGKAVKKAGDDSDADSDFADYDPDLKSLADVNKEITQGNSDNPYSQMRKYKTDIVKYHIDAVRSTYRIKNMAEKVYDEGQKKVNGLLKPILSDVEKFEFIDPETKETLSFKTNPSRVVSSLVINYGRDLPRQEILEMADGFIAATDPRLDMSNKEDMAYAKQRWLESARKLFYLEYNAVKRFEATYGTLPDQLPPGSFLHSLGSSKNLFYSRSYFGQDMTEMTSDKGCEADGEKMSIGQYLVKAGLIKEEELSDAVHLCSGFYQNVNGYYSNALGQGIMAFETGKSETYTHSSGMHLEQLNGRRQYEIKGPRLTYDQERKYWKDALEQGNASLYGGGATTSFKKHALDLYSEAERRNIQTGRKNDAELINLYEGASNNRAEALFAMIKGKMAEKKIKADDGLLRRMIVFHPDMMSTTDTDKISQEATDQFIRLFESLTGAGIPEEERAKKRTEAYRELIERIKTVREKQSFKTNDPDKLIENEISKNRKVISHKSRLMRTIVIEQQLNAVQSLMKEEEDKSLIPEETLNEFRDLQGNILSNLIIKNMKKSRRYLDLKDIGNRYKSVPDIEQNEVETVLAKLAIKADDPDDVLTGFGRELLRRLYGLDIASRNEILGLQVEEKEADDIDIEIKPAMEAKKLKPSEKAVKNFIDELFVDERDEITEASLNLPALPEYKRVRQPAVRYEFQDTANCWCCSGAAIFNKFVEQQDGKLDEKDIVDQYQIRAFRPGENEMKTLDQVKAETEGNVNEKMYKEAKKKTLDFMGRGKKAYGSIFEAADFFMKKRTDFVLNRMRITLPAFDPTTIDENGNAIKRKTAEDRKNDVIRLHNQKAAFLKTVYDVLQTGNLVSLYIAEEEHYLTITEVDGEYLTCLDSMQKNPERRINISDIMKRTDEGTIIELNWFSKLKQPRDMVDENGGLLYQNGEYSVPRELATVEEALNIAHTRGICIGKSEGQLGENMEGIGLVRYIPKYGNKMLKDPDPENIIIGKKEQDQENIIIEKQEPEKIIIEKEPEKKNIINEKKQEPLNSIIEEEDQESIIKEEQKQEQEIIIKEAYKQEQEKAQKDEASGVIDRAEMRGSLDVLDELFGGKNEKNAEYATEYAAFMDRIMERNDFSFDEDGINMIRNMIDDQVKDKSKAEKAKETFDKKLAPEFRRVFRLVTDGRISEDTAKIFLNPDAMTYEMKADEKTVFDDRIYRTFTARSKHKTQRDEIDYKMEVADLAGYYMDNNEAVTMQSKTENNTFKNKKSAETAIMDHDNNVMFHVNSEKAETINKNARCYVTVKENSQKKMVIRLREYIKKNEKFRGAFDFKLSSSQNGKKLDNIVIYYDSVKDAGLLEEFIRDFGDGIQDITSNDESIPTLVNIKQGIGISAEPGEAYKQLYTMGHTYNPLSAGDYSIKEDKLLKGHAKSFAVKSGNRGFKLSWNRYCSRLFILSAYVARHRLGEKGMDITVSKNDAMKKEMKNAFREFTILSGIDPATLMLENGNKEDVGEKQ